jgi:hypothetical protein
LIQYTPQYGVSLLQLQLLALHCSRV